MDNNNNKINWKQKLTSRKFWAAIITFITTILVAFGINDVTIEQIIAIVSAASVMIAYIIGEGLVDSARLNNDSKITTVQLDKENDNN